MEEDMSETPKKLVYDFETGETSYIDYTPEEIAQRDQDLAAYNERKALEEAEAERIEALKSIKSINITIDEIIIKISVCRGILKWLKLQDREFSMQERVALREVFNAEIGIYGKPKE